MSPQKNRKINLNRFISAHVDRTIALFVLFCLCVGGMSFVYAKYIQSQTVDSAVKAYDFYFESDLLDGKTHEVVPTEENGTASVTIRLKNYVDDLRCSDTAIDYVVSVDATDVTIDKNSGSLDSNNKYADIKLSGLEAGKTYEVTASTENTYKENTYNKTLTGIIKVKQQDTTVNASIDDRTQYIEVTVWTTDYAGGDIKLSYAGSLIPDNTDDKLTNDNRITFNDWKANTSHVFRFFKSDTSKKYSVSVNDKEVTVNEK